MAKSFKIIRAPRGEPLMLFVDDVRPVPDGWKGARTVHDAKLLLSTGEVEYLSLDHDMGACADCVRAGAHIGDMNTPETTFYNHCSHAEDGTSLVRWMVENNVWPKYKPTVHSMNPVGAERMRQMIDRYGPYSTTSNSDV